VVTVNSNDDNGDGDNEDDKDDGGEGGGGKSDQVRDRRDNLGMKKSSIGGKQYLDYL